MKENGFAATLVAKSSAGVTPEVNLKGCVAHTPLPSGNKAALKPIIIIIIISPKQGYQWSDKKGLCPPIYFLKKLDIIDQLGHFSAQF